MNGNTMLSVSVVVAIRKAARTLPQCLAALERLDPAPAEILLVDNGSTDGSLPLIRAFAREHAAEDVRVLEEPRRGATFARNTGIWAAKGDVIAFTDSDCAPHSGWLGHLTEPFVDPTVGAVAGRVVPASAASTVELLSTLYTLQLPDQPARQRQWTPWKGGYPTANLAVRHALLKDLGGFDEGLPGGEDYDLCARLYARGAELAYVPKAAVAHHHRVTLSGMLHQAFRFGRNHPLLLARHARRGLWVSLPGRPLAWSRCPVRAWVDLAPADKK
ncbi:MAG: glycosyltransferase, partial [Acidobacteriota bacterium]